MRQLKGGKTKESKKEKLERKKLNREIQDKFNTIVIPTLVTIAVLIIVYVWTKTRPQYN